MIGFLSSAAAKVKALQGGRRLLAAFGAGLLCALAFTPFHAIPVLWVGFPVLILLLQSAERGREAFAIGWSFAFGLLILCLYWIAGALFVDIRSFW
ncbi:MAG: apolipoprotein N-acyltransferase, partial [Bdellovibrionales bacterium]